jgi:hypothetical protein
MDVAGTFSLDSGDKRSKTGPFRAKKWNWNKGLGSMLPARNQDGFAICVAPAQFHQAGAADRR